MIIKGRTAGLAEQNSVVQVRGLESGADLEQVWQLGTRVFQEAPVRAWREWIPADPTYRAMNQRVLEVDGRIIAHALIVERVIRVGIARLLVGGLSGVMVAPEFRGQGYGRMLMQDCIATMTRQNYELSLLDSIPNFYHRFGYATVWPHYVVSVKASVAAMLEPALSARMASERDLPAMMAMHEAAWLERPGSLVRNEAYWRWKMPQLRIQRVVVDAEGHVHGYYLANVPTKVLEVVANGREAALSLLADMGRSARDAGAETFAIYVPPDDLFTRWARETVPLEICQHSTPRGGWMGRFINVQRAFAKLTEELGLRILRSPYRDWRGRLRIQTDIGTVSLGFRYAQPVLLSDESTSGLTCRLSQAKLAQLLFGYRSVFEVIEDDDVHIARDAIPLLAALFPQRVSALSALDWF